jgi:hypothetical protein
MAHPKVAVAYAVGVPDPSPVWLRREDELPQKSSGKADKTALRAEAARLTAEARRV